MGAAIAAGSQKWNGMRADFEMAPTSSSMSAVVRYASETMPEPSVATIELIRLENE